MRAFPREIPASSAHFARFSPHRRVFRDRTPRNAHSTHFSPRSAPQRSAQEQGAVTHPPIRHAAFGSIRQSCRTALRKGQTTCKEALDIAFNNPHLWCSFHALPKQHETQSLQWDYCINILGMNDGPIKVASKQWSHPRGEVQAQARQGKLLPEHQARTAAKPQTEHRALLAAELQAKQQGRPQPSRANSQAKPQHRQSRVKRIARGLVRVMRSLYAEPSFELKGMPW